MLLRYAKKTYKGKVSSKEAIDYWTVSAERNLSAAEDLFKTGHNVECLFFGHLVIEKMIKAVIAKEGNEPPPVHHLPYLVSLTKIKLDNKRERLLREVNDFNLRTRYDDYKYRFYKIADKKFTAEKFQKIVELYQWLKKQV